MIRMTEVVTQAGNYDPELGKVRSGYSLRGIYVNPKYIISMIDNAKFNELHERSAIVKDLSPKAKFTKLTIAAGTHGVTTYDILGDPKQNIERISGRTQ